ncbi:hypothetical protein Spb1_40700 [Planctopirus ephydatiae]|uniref:Uncharacterized protein n=1 Tax=Planctopirus ephydatiae TaxID=2528019 RepID=A0A518GU67_9PLAN|nr:hypothetical protein Spb1_40700 [Planctopirus ephydatiae]
MPIPVGVRNKPLWQARTVRLKFFLGKVLGRFKIVPKLLGMLCMILSTEDAKGKQELACI